MKILTKLEKKKVTWFLIGLSVVFFLLRLPSLIEPNWYGDEGIYQVISLALTNGWGLYTDIWDNKPPLLYLTYTLFGGDQFAVRLLSLLFGISAMLLFFFLSLKLLRTTKAAGIATIAFAFLFGSPYLEGNIANAENFILPLTITAGLLVYRYSQHTTEEKRHSKFHLSSFFSPKPFLIAGILLGIAFLFKIVAFFDFAAFTAFLIVSSLHEKPVTKHHLKSKHFLQSSILLILPLVTGFIIPLVITLIIFTFSGSLSAFIQAAFFGNIDYVGYGNTFIIPQGLLFIKVVLFFLALLFIFIKRHTFTKPILFISLWFVFEVFSAFFSQRPYTHYLLVILPGFCLLTGLFFTRKTLLEKTRIIVALLVISLIAINYFHVFGVGKTFDYYTNAITFLSGQKSVKDYQAFFDPETPRDYELVSYINNHTTTNDTIFLWGDSPQIYYLTKKLPPGKYTVAYHILQDPNGVAETQAIIDKKQPRFIITLAEAPQLPFGLPGYTGKYGIKGAAIYERSY